MGPIGTKNVNAAGVPAGSRIFMAAPLGVSSGTRHEEADPHGVVFWEGEEGLKLQAAAGDGQEATVTNALPRELTVRVFEPGNKPKQGVAVTWTIAQVPVRDGRRAQGQGLSQPSAFSGAIGLAAAPGLGGSGAPAPAGTERLEAASDAQGLSRVRMTLGDLTGVYQVEAACADCTPNVVSFTGAGKLRLEMTLDRTEVRPLKTGGTNTVRIELVATGPTGPVGPDYPLRIEALGVLDSGGHRHPRPGTDDPPRPAGAFPNGRGDFDCSTGEGGRCVVAQAPPASLLPAYTAGEVGGEDKLRAFAALEPLIALERILLVRVADLIPLPEPASASQYRQIGGRCTHHGPVAADSTVPLGCRTPNDNHYGAPDVIEALPLIAFAYAAHFPERNVIKFNDISLHAGGLFDIDGNWKAAHGTHRTGRDVDVRSDPPHENEVPLEDIEELNRIINRLFPNAIGTPHGKGSNRHFHIDFPKPRMTGGP